MGSGIDNKINEFLCNPNNVKKRINTRLEKCYGHVNIATAIMKTRQRFWVIYGIGSVKHFLHICAKCVILTAKPIRQLMSDLPECRLTLCYKPFKFCELYNFEPILISRGTQWAKDLGFALYLLVYEVFACESCYWSRLKQLFACILSFRFTSLRRSVDTVKSDSASTFSSCCWPLAWLAGLYAEFQNALRKSGINWVRIPGYAPSQRRSWDIMAKLFKALWIKV